MPTLRDSAIALRRYEYAENSQIIAFLAREHGQVRVIAKGIKRSTKKRFAVGVDLLDIGTITFSVKSADADRLATLTEWKQATFLGGLRERLHRLRAAEYAAEITAALTVEFDPHAGLFEALLACLTSLAESDEPFESVISYQHDLLSAAGSWPLFSRCVSCGRHEGLSHFSSWQGGMFCATCAPATPERRPVRPQTLAVLQSRERLAGAEGAFALLDYHITHLLGRPPELSAYLLSPARQRPSRLR